MTADELEELLDGCNVTNMLGYSEAYEELRDLSPSLARRVIAAEKLVEALKRAEVQSVHWGYDNVAGGGNFIYKDAIFVDDFKGALNEYEEANK